MIGILFVCHGNICRSPMAEFILKDMVRRGNRQNEFFISSAATSTEEIGNDIYPPAKGVLRKHGIPFTAHHARQVTRSDYSKYDLLICMDHNNYRNIIRLLGSDPENKIRLLSEHDIEDPWYTGDFETVFSEIQDGCDAILDQN